MTEVTLKVQGMSCGHCVQSVKGALEPVEGISEVEVSLENGEVKVTYDEAKVDKDLIKQLIEDNGYDVVA